MPGSAPNFQCEASAAAEGRASQFLAQALNLIRVGSLAEPFRQLHESLALPFRLAESVLHQGGEHAADARVLGASHGLHAPRRAGGQHNRLAMGCGTGCHDNTITVLALKTDLTENALMTALVIKADSVLYRQPETVSLRCPSCRQVGTFDGLGQDLQTSPDGYIAGQRRCPNPQCRAHAFVVLRNGGVAASYPPEYIDFDSTAIPETVAATLEEALACHANGCFKASAMMVRRTLEALCGDRGARGENLKAMVVDLGSKIVLPKKLLDALDNLRLLGNDAAHVKSRDYETIGETEVEVAIDFTKEVLKAAYQYSVLVGRLEGLKKQPS